MEQRQSEGRGVLPAAFAVSLILAAALICAAVFGVKEGGVSEAAVPWLLRGILAVSAFTGGFAAAKGRRRRFLTGLFAGTVIFAGICLAARAVLAGEFRLSAAQLPSALCCLVPGMAGAIVRGG